VMEIQKQLRVRFNRFIDRCGWKGLVALIFYPVTTLVTTPVRLVQTLWNCRVLADGKNWGNYPHFSPHSAVNSLFYWTRALNLYRYGRSGKGPNLGLGDYSLTRCFHYSLLSFYAYWKAGAVTLLLGMFGWWAGHFLWLDQSGINFWWIFSVLTLALFSTTFYSNAFALQNYNALGWLFVPVTLYAWYNKLWILASLSLLCASFCSITVVFLMCWLALCLSLNSWSLFPILTVIPSCTKLLTHLYPFLMNGGILGTIGSIAKAVGLTKKNSKYIRSGMMRLGIGRIYFLLIYSQFVFVSLLVNRTIPMLLVVSIVIWIINFRFARFADDQSMYMLVLSVATATTIQSNTYNIYVLLSFWMLVSPIPKLIGFPNHNCFTVVPKFKPFDISPILNEMTKFLSPVQEGQRVHMAFDDPHGRYELIFDGYRILLETPLYIAARKNFHFMPDWWGVWELNSESDRDFWGREVDDVKNQMNAWCADFVVVYQESGTELDDKWKLAGFKQASRFSWKEFEGYARPYSGPAPDWWLLGYEKGRNEARTEAGLGFGLR